MFRNDNFEHADLGQYSASTGTPTFETQDPAREGIYCLRCNPAAAAEGVTVNLPAGTRKAATSLYLRFRVLPPGTCTFFRFTGPDCTLRWRGVSGTLNMAIFGATSDDVGPVVVAGRWYLVDIVADSSTGLTTMDARVDGGTEAHSERAQAAGDMTAADLGATNAQTFDIDFDLWQVGLPPGDNYPLSGLQAPGNAHIAERIRRPRQGKLVRR